MKRPPRQYSPSDRQGHRRHENASVRSALYRMQYKWLTVSFCLFEILGKAVIQDRDGQFWVVVRTIDSLFDRYSGLKDIIAFLTVQGFHGTVPLAQGGLQGRKKLEVIYLTASLVLSSRL